MRSLSKGSVLLLVVVLLLAACSETTAPSQAPAVAEPVITITIDTLRVRGYLTPLPDRRFCGYGAPIPADTTKRFWNCKFPVAVTQ